MATSGGAARDDSLTRTALALAAATVLAWLVLAGMEHDGAGWLVQPILGAATAVIAWRAGGRSPQNTRALVALIIGVLAILVFFGFVIAGG